MASPQAPSTPLARCGLASAQPHLHARSHAPEEMELTSHLSNEYEQTI
ncbi:uncharacterized protein METZ01_LOCUS479145 [marine metagenome]|uniref:Uncharacterized protein n=1 Tax=marine metagenome TaxID=408172 RepID=A0A383C294_9ZZZZ